MFRRIQRRIENTKQFVHEHKTGLVFTAGGVFGTATTLYCVRTIPKEINLTATPEMLKQLIDHPHGSIWWTRKDGTTIRILNELHDQLQEGR